MNIIKEPKIKTIKNVPDLVVKGYKSTDSRDTKSGRNRGHYYQMKIKIAAIKIFELAFRR